MSSRSDYSNSISPSQPDSTFSAQHFHSQIGNGLYFRYLTTNCPARCCPLKSTSYFPEICLFSPFSPLTQTRAWVASSHLPSTEHCLASTFHHCASGPRPLKHLGPRKGINLAVKKFEIENAPLVLSNVGRKVRDIGFDILSVTRITRILAQLRNRYDSPSAYHAVAAPIRILSKIFTSKGSRTNSPTVCCKCLK
jgi:hypothetical protein